MESDGFLEVTLGEVAAELTDRAAKKQGHRKVYGVQRGIGLTPETRYAASDLSRYKVIEPGDFAYNPMRLNIGSIGMCTEEMGPGLVSPDYVAFRLCRDVDPSFLYYYTEMGVWKEWVERAGGGSVRTRIYFKNLAEMPLRVPDMQVQKRASALLRMLDDRIDLLRQTNATLEAITQALFKSWFVDFAPVRAKAEGRDPEGMDAATAALFPCEFEESELGLVPRGWRTQAVYEAAQYINGAAYRAFNPNTERRGLPIIKIAELKSGVTGQTAFSDEVMAPKYRIDTGDVLFSWSGNPDTSIDTFVWSRGPALLNQHIFRVVPTSKCDRSRIIAMLKFLRPRFAEVARNKQTTGLGHVTVADLKEMRVVLPPSEVVACWNRIVDPIVEKALSTQLQGQLLEDLRDTLLPRLISGKMRLPEAQAVIEDSTA